MTISTNFVDSGVDFGAKYLTKEYIATNYSALSLPIDQSAAALLNWGDNSTGQFGNSLTAHRSSPVQLSSTGGWYRSISMGNHVAAIDRDFNLWMWGTNSAGQLAQNDVVSRSSPIQVAGGVVISFNGTTAVNTTTDVITLPTSPGQLAFGDPVTYKSVIGTAIGGLVNNGIYYVFSGGTSIILSPFVPPANGIGVQLDLTAVGSNDTGHSLTFPTPRAIGVALGASHTVYTSIKRTVGDYVNQPFETRTVYAWGLNSSGQLGQTDLVHRSSPVQISTYEDSSNLKLITPYNISAGGNNTGIIDYETNKLYLYGDNASGQIVVNRSWNVVSASDFNFAAIRSDGSLWVWGNNDQGQLGFNDTVHRSSPTQIGTSSWTTVSTNGNAMAAIRSDGALFTWGSNFNGVLGQNLDNQNRSSPVQVGTSSWTKVGLGAYHGLAIRIDGGLFSWGDSSSYGNLGSNNTVSRSSPVQIGTSSWTSVSAKWQNSLAIRTDGALFTWGNNEFGKLGLSDTAHRSSPVQVGTRSWTLAAAGGDHTVAIDNTGAMFSWGDNKSGQLGYGTNEITSAWGEVYVWGANPYFQLGNYAPFSGASSPIQLSGGGSWKFLDSSHLAAIRYDGALFVWGPNTQGEAGINLSGGSGVINSQSVPTIIGGALWTSVQTYGATRYAIRTDGALFTWGYNNTGQLALGDTISRSSPVQVGTSSWSQITSGPFAIRQDGALFAWGTGNLGAQGLNDVGIFRSSPVQVGTSSWTMVSRGGGPVFAIRSDGGLFGWGYGAYGAVGVSDLIHRSSPVQIGTSSWSFVSAGYTAYAIRNDGGLFAWGSNDNGQLGNLSLAHRSSPVQIGTSSWTSVYAGSNPTTGSFYVTALRSDNTLWSWGSNDNGQLGLGDTVHRSSPVQVGSVTSWKSISAGGGLTYGNIPGLNPRSSPIQIGTSNWTSVSAGYSQSAAISSSNGLYFWGNNSNNQLLDGTSTHRSAPVQIGSLGWSAISVANKVIGIQSGASVNAIAVWGSNTYGTAVSIGNWVQAADGNNTWENITIGDGTVIGTASNGKLYTWGSNSNGKLGRGLNSVSLTNANIPIQIYPEYTDISWTALSTGPNHSLGVKANGSLWAWGDGYSTGSLGLGDPSIAGLGYVSSPVQVGTSSWIAVAAGKTASLAVRYDGTLWGWGTDTSGTLQQNIGNVVSSPIQIGALSNWKSVSLKASHAVALANDGSIYTWGSNTYGQLGFGDYVHRSSPTQIGTSSWTLVSAGDYHTAAIRSDSKLFTWGRNNYGQLGTYSGGPAYLYGYAGYTGLREGTASFPGTWCNFNPFQELSSASFDGYDAGGYSFPLPSNWNQIITFGADTSAGIKADGTLWMWGNNSAPYLIPGAVVGGAASSPVQIGSDSWYSIKGGNYSGYGLIAGIKTDGSLWAWGYNSYGQLGLSDVAHRSSPVQVGTSSWSQVAISNLSYNTMAIRADGTLWMWGGSGSSRIPGYSTLSLSSPVQVGTDKWKFIDCHLDNFAAIKLDGSLWVWGDNTTGQLAYNDTTVRPLNEVALVSSGYSWKSVSVGNQMISGIQENGSLWVWGNNSGGQLGLNDVLSRSSPVQVGTSSWTLITAPKVSNSGYNTVYGIKVDNSLWQWGFPYAGGQTLSSPVQLGTKNNWVSISELTATNNISLRYFIENSNVGDTITRLFPTQVGSNSWRYISTGSSHTAAIRSDSKLFTWGDNNIGTLGLIDPTVSTSRALYVAGGNIYGELGIGTQGYNVSQTSYTTVAGSVPLIPLDGSNWKAVVGNITSGYPTAAAIKVDGSLWMWGINDQGQLGLSDRIHRSSPVQVGTSSWMSVTVGNRTTAAIRIDGALFTWGYNNTGLLGDGGTLHRSSPVQVGTSSWIAINASADYGGIYGSFDAIRSDGALFGWGSWNNGIFKDSGSIIDRYSPVLFGTSSWSQITTNMAIRTDGALFTWGASSPVQVGTSSWIAIGGTENRVYSAIRTDGALFTWNGYSIPNTWGTLGQNNTISNSSPVQIGSNSWSSVSAGYYNVMAIQADGTLWQWGRDIETRYYRPASGFVWNNVAAIISAHRSSPVQVGTANIWNKVYIGVNFGLVDGYGGRVLVNKYALANVSTATRSSPVQIGTSSWSFVTTTDNNTAAIRSDGGLFIWGTGADYVRGVSDTTHRSSPVQVGTSSWSFVTVQNGALALKPDRTLYAWGLNSTGKLGLNDTLDRSAPTIVPQNNLSWRVVKSGINSSAALSQNGTLFVWGSNSSGQLGQNDTVHRSSPIQVGTYQWISAVEVDNGTASSFIGLRYDGTLWGWGDNAKGQLGLSDLAHRSSPVQVGTLNTWKTIGGGKGAVAAILSYGDTF